MSNRERWIVYPALLLSLTIGIRTVFNTTGTARFHTVVCQQLLVESTQGEPIAHLEEGVRGGGRLVILGQGPETEKERGRESRRFSAIDLQSGPAGGLVTISRPDGNALAIGHDDERDLSGVYGIARDVTQPHPALQYNEREGTWTLQWKEARD